MMRFTTAFEFAGPTKPRRRKREADTVLVHRNTVSALYRERHPNFKGCSLEAMMRGFRDPEIVGPDVFSTNPYHLFVSMENGSGLVQQVHTLDSVSPHAAQMNSRAIALTFDHDGRKGPLPRPMWDAGVWALRKLVCWKPELIVRGHDARKGCPGEFVDVEALEVEARSERLSADPAPLILEAIW